MFFDFASHNLYDTYYFLVFFVSFVDKNVLVRNISYQQYKHHSVFGISKNSSPKVY
jgi:hypothetical protein